MAITHGLRTERGIVLVDTEYGEMTKRDEDYDLVLKKTQQYKRDKDARANSGWDANAQRAYEFVFGNQWPSAIKAKLRSQERPTLVFNLILKAMNIMVGHMLQSSADITVLPVDRQADPYVARLLQKAIKNIEYWNKAATEQKAQFIDGWITGVGVKEKYIDYSRDINGEIKCHQIPASECILDPTFRKYDYSDASRFTRELWLSKDEIKRIYGKKFADKLDKPTSEDIESLPSFVVQKGYATNTDYGNDGGELQGKAFLELANQCGYDVKNSTWRVVECYTREWHETEVYYNPETQDYDDVAMLADEERALVEGMTITRQQPVIHLTTIIADMVAEDKDTDAEDWEHLFDFYFPFFVNGYFMGGVQNLIDPQMEVNKRYSTIIDILTRIANSGIFYKRGIFDKEDEANIDQLLAQNGMAIGVEELYDEHGHKTIEERQPPQVPAIYERIMDWDKSTIEYISGATPGMQGNVPRKQTGIAKKVDINQASIGLMDMIDNFRATRESEGRSYIWMIQKYKNEEWMLRVYGDTFGEDEDEITLNKQAAGMIFNDVTIGKYDVVLSFEGKTPTEREATYWKVIEYANAVPQYAPAFADTLIDLMALPETRKIKQKIEQINQQQQMAQQAQQQAQGQPPQGGSARREPQRVQG